MDTRTLKVLEYDKILQRLKDFAVSDLGKELAGSVLPVTEIELVSRLLDDTTEAVSLVMRKGNPPLYGLHDITSSLKRAKIGSVLSPSELLRVADVLRTSRNFIKYMSDEDDKTKGSIKELSALLYYDKSLEEKINSCILNEEEIADNASSLLSSIRKQIRQQQEHIKDRLNEMIRSARYQKFMQDPIVTIRQDRYVIPVKQEYRNEIQGLIHDSSSSGATIYIEPMAVVEANNKIKQLKIKEQLEITRILQELTSDVQNIADNLFSAIDALARLDVIFAKARLSIDDKCVQPKVNKEGRIHLKKARHPLLEKDKVVPIDIWLGQTFRTLVITGPNTGGKTVTLKTLGLLTLMAQSGLHIPVFEGSEIAVFEKVFADIGDEQSIEQSLSTFSSHMKNIVSVLNEADANSLVLFDELGAGTDPAEGAALAMAILDFLHDRGCVAAATTHYSELKVYALTRHGVENACCEFDVDTLRPTYRLLIGIPGKSNAFAISKKLGLSEEILQTARHFLKQEDIRFEDILNELESNRKNAEEQKKKAEEARMEAEKLKHEIEEQKLKINMQKDKILKEAREEARKILIEAREEATKIIEELKKAQKEQQQAEQVRAIEEARRKLKNKIDCVEDALVQSLMPNQSFVKSPEHLKPGDTVLVVSLNQKATVLEPPDSKGEVLIQAGIMKINVHISNLRLADEQKEYAGKTGIGKISVSKAQKATTEADVRGMCLEEALQYVDKFLDDSVIANLPSVTIIHGKGTGILRSGIHRFLKNDSRVKSYRLGKYGEGETGVTIVELK